MPKLKRALSLLEETFFGVGLILGAGIYAIIGLATALSGPALWLSVIAASTVALFTGLSYAELSSLYPEAGSSYVYIKKAFKGLTFLGFLTGWLIFFESVTGASTVALVFASYLKTIVPVPIVLTAIGVVAFFSFINAYGIELSGKVNILFTSIEAFGLLLMSWLGFTRGPLDPNYLHTPMGINGILSGASLIFFAFLGFESIAATSEEAEKPTLTIPKAILVSLLVCTLLYISVALSIVRLLPWQKLGKSTSPFTIAAQVALGNWSWLFSYIALFATANTVLGLSISGSRMLYGMGKDRILPETLAAIGSITRTPHFAIFLAGYIATIECVLGSLKLVAQAANLGALVVFVFVNSAVILLRKKSKKKRSFKVPGSVKGIPLIPVFGILTSGLLITYFEWKAWLLMLVTLGFGFVVYKLT